MAAGLQGCSESATSNGQNVEHDEITTVTLTMTNTSTLSTQAFVWEDIDGVGGKGPNRIDTITLAADSVYKGSLAFENRKVVPTVNVTTDILNERNNHQVFYTKTGAVMTITTTDLDARNLPLGLKTSWTDVRSSVGALTVSLSHYPDSTTKKGTNPSTSTDVNVTFPVVIR
jgi:hypothetical protein